MTTTPYQRRKAWIASLSPERKARHKAEMAARHQLAKVYRPLKRGQPLRDDVALAVVGMRAAECEFRFNPAGDSDLMSAAVPISCRPPFRNEAGHLSRSRL